MVELSGLKSLIKRTPLGHVVQDLRAASSLRRWQNSERTQPPPHLYKVRTVKEYARRFGTSTFIETGTYFGDMVNKVKSQFSRIISIEVDERLYHEAAKRFRKHPHITILHGDSAAVLPAVLEQIKEPCLFWLDGHYSGGVTGMGSEVTPVLTEVRSICAHHVSKHIILIDDARLFGADEGYPSLDQLRTVVTQCGRGLNFAVDGDIIRLN
jgi:hypothetical protein